MFSPKRPWEEEYFGFRYKRLLPEGVTITAAQFSISVLEGSDPAAAGMISGPAAIAGDKVSQLVVGGVDGVKYELVCKADFSDNQKKVTLCDAFYVRAACEC